ncbi:MAG: hypothetical protein RLY69_96, partial [Verrucomicrobiota bacterium]
MQTGHRQLVAPLNNTEFCTVDEVASLGFEPRITESKSGVLPLHYEAFGALEEARRRAESKPPSGNL